MNPTMSDPVAVVRAIFDALAAGEWESVADRVRPQALRSFREIELGFVRSRMRERARTPAEMSRDMDGAPPEVGAFFAAREAEQLASQPRWTPTVFGADTFAELEAFPPRLLFVRWLAATYEGSIPWQAYGGSRREIRREVLGCVLEERDERRLAHVVYRVFDSPAWEGGDGKVLMTTLRFQRVRGWTIGVDHALLTPGRKG